MIDRPYINTCFIILLHYYIITITRRYLSLQDESQLDGLNGEVRHRMTELDQLKVGVEQSRAELVELGVEKTTAEAANVKLKREKGQLDEIQRNLQGKIRQLKRFEAMFYFKAASSRRLCGSSRLKRILLQRNIPSIYKRRRLYDYVSLI